MEFEGKRALVTGGAQGIGAATARRLAIGGAKVMVCDRQGERAERIASEIGGLPVTVDLGDRDSLQRLIASLGPVDLLVNAAGICTTQPIDAITPDGFARTFAVNVEATFFLSRACGDRMPSGGAIVNLASVSAFLGKLEQVDYGASKAAIVSLTRSLALIYGPRGIRVNAVAPGVIETPLTLQIAEQRASIRGVTPEETLKPTIAATPLGRIGSPEEVAEAVVFLASDRASFITGQTLDVCGGFLMR